MLDNTLPDGARFRDYVVEKLLGRGGIGAVYLVRHNVLDTYYALKVLDPAVVDEDEMFLKRFLREARLASRIRHPNLVAVYDCGRDDATGLYYLVMDYVSGSSLRNVLAFEDHLPIQRAAQIVSQVASALNAAQPFQVVHRDIKPENIMIQSDGLVKLVDLGVAKAQGLGDSIHTTTDSVFGTPAYISPEQAQSSANVDVRADIYSLGMVFFEMITGKCPYGGRSVAQTIAAILSDDPTPDIRDFCPGMSDDVAVLIRRMTCKDVNRRLASFDDVLAELSHLEGVVLAVNSVPVELASRPEVGMKTLLGNLGVSETAEIKPNAVPDRNRSMPWMIVGLVLVVLLGILLLFVWH